MPIVYVEAAEVLGCTRNIDLMHFIAIPSALPSIVAGIRIASGMGWMCLVTAEYLIWGISTGGLGYQIWYNYYLHRTDYAFAYILLLRLVGLFIDHFFRHYVDAKLEMGVRNCGIKPKSLSDGDNQNRRTRNL